MKLAHYEEGTGRLLGWYDSSFHESIPVPSLEFSDLAWQESIDGGFNRVNISESKMELVDFRTDEEKAQHELLSNKYSRALAVDAIQVTTASGKTFDGDEISQGRISRAVTSSEPLETTTWILSDNTPAEVTREELKEALRLAGHAQTAIWIA